MVADWWAPGVLDWKVAANWTNTTSEGQRLGPVRCSPANGLPSTRCLGSPPPVVSLGKPTFVAACREGHAGATCGRCAPGYYKTLSLAGGSCSACPADAPVWTAVAAAAAGYNATTGNGTAWVAGLSLIHI